MRAVVTGAAGGIGRASALRFAEEGAAVLCVDRAASVGETAQAIRDAGGDAIAVEADTGDEAAVRGFVERCVSTWGGIDAIFANAGISGGRPSFTDMTVLHWTEILRINLIGPFLAIREAIGPMTRQGRGSIVMTASVAGLRANAGSAAYAASKAGVISLAQTAANELIGTGVRVNVICPGRVETNMTRPIFERARDMGMGEQLGGLVPLQRVGQPGDVAEMAVFLASDKASFITGQAYAVDGGLTSTHPFGAYSTPIR